MASWHSTFNWYSFYFKKHAILFLSGRTQPSGFGVKEMPKSSIPEEFSEEMGMYEASILTQF